MMEEALEEILTDDDVRLIGDLAAGLSVDAFLVGGGLRDCLLGRELHDLDFVLTGACAILPRLFAARTGGTFFWLDEGRKQGRVVRKGAEGTLVYDFAPLRGATVGDDLVQRDFTINALALPVTGDIRHLADPLHGLDDLRRGVIRACADSTFADDPLRLLRALRFAAELGFAIEKSTWSALRQNAPLLAQVAAERVRDELFRILGEPGVAASLHHLGKAGLWPEIYPAGFSGGGGDDSAERSSTLSDRQIKDAEEVERVCSRLAALFPKTNRQLTLYLDRAVESGISVMSLMKLAAVLGRGDRDGACALAERLRLGREAGRLLASLCTDEKPLLGVLERNATERAVYRFFRDREPAGLGMLIVAEAAGAISESCCTGLAAYYLESYAAQEPDLFLTGDEVMGLLGAGPGNIVGTAMARLREAESTSLVNSREEAREFVKNLLTREGALR